MSAVDEAALRLLITERVAAWNGVAPQDVPMDRPLADLGMASRDAVALAGELSRATGRDLPTTLLWEAPTGQDLVARLCRAGATRAEAAPAPPSALPGAPPSALPGGTAEPVAVVGVGCRLPGGAHGPGGFWRLLSDGADAIRGVPEDRWRDFTAFPPADAHPYGGYLDDIAGFDADFFRITPREAAVMDPQQRILLEVVHEALDHAAVPAASLAGTATGVFVGISAPEYGQLTGADPAAVDPRAPAGGALSVAAGRLSYVLDARGPSLAVDTACSSSLVAVHHACVSLRTGESDTAIAAGVNLLLSPAVTVAFRRAGALAADGRCKPFSAAADGIGRGEGCAAVILKRLSDAERDGDRVLAVVRASTVNSDGRSNGLMAPNPAAQQALLERAYTQAGIAAALVDYVEAHGTGTPLGDPIEAEALGAVLGVGRNPDQPLLLGSAKGNLGHLESAAGIAGLVKTVLALHHDAIPPSLHCERGSSLSDPRLRVVTEPEPWPRYSGTAVAGVSGFGFGGTNAHVVLEEAPPDLVPARPAEEPAARLHLLSDFDAERLRDTAGRLAARLRDSPAHPADVARTLAGRTGRGPVRAAVIARDRAELADTLDGLASGRSDARVTTGDRDRVGRGTVWVFSGYGSQWPGMGRRLLAEEPAFAAAVEKLDPQLAPECGLSLHDRLSSGEGLHRLEVAQPVLFGVQLALAELWRSHGVEPAAVIGHSMGEVAAAVCAGALDVTDGARVIAVRARLLSGLRGGAMAVVDLDDAELDALGRDFPQVHVAVHSSPRQKVVTGEKGAVAALVRRLEGQGRAARAMAVVGAGHSPQVDGLLPELVAALSGIRGRQPCVPVHSTVLDDPRGDCLFDAAHWAANLRRPVRLDRALASAAADGHTAFVEVSPHPVLTGAVADTVPGALALATLRRDADGSEAFAGQLGALYTAGQRLAVPPGRVIDLPLPRWRHVRHWWTDGRGTRPAPAPERGVPEVPRRSTDGVPQRANGTGPERATGEVPYRAAGEVPYRAAGEVPYRAAGEVPHHATGEIPYHAAGEVPYRAAGELPGAPTVLARLTHHIATVTGHSPARVTPSTAWADLGLDSLMAVRIRTAVELEFGVELPLRELFAAVTVDDAATRIERALPRDDTPVRPLRATGSRPPLFLVHAAGGPAGVYRPLAERLGDDQPVYGLERIEEARTVPEKARRYAEAIKAVRPDGPCVLGGWSFGGFVAQETARQLTAAGREVRLVVLIDSVRPLPTPGLTRSDRMRAHFEGFARHVADTYGVQLDLPYDELVAMDDDAARIDSVLHTLREAADVPAAALEHQRASYLDMGVGESHSPAAHDGPVVLYRATAPAPHTVRDPAYERDDRALGWDEVCPRLEVVPVAGHHLSLLDPPHVDAIAAHLSRMLAQPAP
ncbi:acyltransferase domain-containing protein [Streptomyces sp. NPDC101110]|uniref:acyltransferase domain-containing protein n=1 Tax=Streptomyces sp. NPDC101110 TaxID=3366104 RepID=UPI0038093074